MPPFASFDLTHFDLAPAVRSVVSATEGVRRVATDVATEATYTVIGLAVLSYQRAQIRRRELERSLRDG